MKMEGELRIRWEGCLARRLRGTLLSPIGHFELHLLLEANLVKRLETNLANRA